MKTHVLLAALVLAASCGKKESNNTPDDGPLPTGDAAWLVVEPASALVEPGEEVELRVRAFDNDGNEVAPPRYQVDLTEPSVVDRSGLIVTGAELGSTRVRVQAEGLSVAEAFIAVADVSDGVLPMRDEQVVSPPADAELVDDVLRYTVVVAPSFEAGPGDIVLSTESAPIMGKVVSRREVDAGSELTLDLVPLDEIFDSLEIHEHGDVGPEHTTVPDAVAERFDVTMEEDGTYVFTPKDTALHPAALSTEWVWGIFDCKAELDFPYGSFGSFTPTISRQFAFNLDYSSSGLRRFSVDGTVTANAKVHPKLAAAVEGKAGCEAELLRVQFPIGGPLSLVFGAGVPLGVGFEMGGKITVANFEMEFEGKVGAKAEVGIECAGDDCEPLHELESIAEARAKFKMPDNSQTRVEPSVDVFGFTGLVVGPTFVRQLGMDLLRAQGGPGLSANLSAFRFQAEDAEYASSYDLQLKGKVGLGSALDWLAKILKKQIGANELEAATPLAKSPAGDYSAPTTWLIGQEVTVTASLSDVRFLSAENVEAVELWDVTPGSVPEQLARVERTTDGQTEYELKYTPNTVLVGTNASRTIAVGVDTVFSPVLIEIGNTHQITLSDGAKCDGVVMEIVPSSQTLTFDTPTPVPVTYTMSGGMEADWTLLGVNYTGSTFTVDDPFEGSFGVAQATLKVQAACPTDRTAVVEAELIVVGPGWLTDCWVPVPGGTGNTLVSGRIQGTSALVSNPVDWEACWNNQGADGSYTFEGSLLRADDGTWYPEVRARVSGFNFSGNATLWGLDGVTFDETMADPAWGRMLQVDRDGTGDAEQRAVCQLDPQSKWMWTVTGTSRECDAPGGS